MKDAPSELRRLPGEDFARNCYVGGPHDLRQASDIGVLNPMWDKAIPHSERTGPYTIEALRTSLWDIPKTTWRPYWPPGPTTYMSWISTRCPQSLIALARRSMGFRPLCR